MIHACKKAQKFLSFILISCLIFSQGIRPTSAATFMQADSELVIHSQSDFSDGQLFGFTPGGSTTATIIDQNGNKVLQTTGSGSGTRSIVKTFSPALNHSKLSIVLDWNPGLVTTASNSSELLIQDVEKNPIFRVVKLGGTNGAIHYGFGNSGADLTGTLPSNLIIADNSWIQVQMDFDFVSEKVLLSLTDLAHPENKVILPDFDLKNIQYVNHIGSLSIVGNRASGQSLAFTTSFKSSLYLRS